MPCHATLAALVALGALGLAVLACAPRATPRPAMGVAAQALVDEAHAAHDAGRLDDASASLERALRLEPGNAGLWNELARVRLDQGLASEAETLALRSIALAGDDRDLLRANWLLVAEARRSRGDESGADAAVAEAEKL